MINARLKGAIGVLIIIFILSGCTNDPMMGTWKYEVRGEEELSGTMEIKDGRKVILNSVELEQVNLQNVTFSDGTLRGTFKAWGEELTLVAYFQKDSFTGSISIEDESFDLFGFRQSDKLVEIDRSEISYILPESSVDEVEKNIDHAGILDDLDRDSYERGARIYNSNCINCHGNEEIEGSIPTAAKFWNDPLMAGNDPYTMYLTLTRGVGSMPPQVTLTPQEKYDVINYVRKRYLRYNEVIDYIPITTGYLKALPEGTSRGSEPTPYHPWSDMNYGNFFINTYELVDEETGPERYHSPGPVPFEDENYLKNNFAYKGIAVRLDEGSGGISDGNSWMIFDHDVMRVAGGWTGDGFIDWQGILLNDQHETYPRTIGKLHFETPVGPGWANPTNGLFEDPRFTARDGRKFGPLPKKWANYKGLYHFGEHIIISYSVGSSNVLEELGRELMDDQTVFTRTLNITPSGSILKMRIAKTGTGVELSGSGATIGEEDGYVVLKVARNSGANIKIFIANQGVKGIEDLARAAEGPENLMPYTNSGGPAHYPQEITSVLTRGQSDGMFAVDQLTPPFDNPWNARMKLSGIDFMKDKNVAVVCTTDGDVFRVTGLLNQTGILKWKRIAAGMFQPLGIKVLDEKIYVTCRDQLVLLRDFNGDFETDFYNSVNHDHQVTDHYHEFAMGLQADDKGNLYYAKSGRHAREALIPQHGTLIKVSKDGSKSEIIATGFRAANGVCINPDGSFLVTDQEGYWNPMNRINWVEVDDEPKFYGNMWGYNPPDDTSRSAMERPMVWVDMEFDRSPSELLWVDSDKWGPLNGSLLSFSYGYGKIQLVLHEEVNGQRQGGVIDLPGVKFLTGVMRGRFNPADGYLYSCGMSAWGTSRIMQGGGLNRVRYTGKPVTIPVGLKALETGVELTFAESLNETIAVQVEHYEIKTWDLVRSAEYGSDRYNIQTLNINRAELKSDRKIVKLYVEGIEPVDVMTISYDVIDEDGNPLIGKIQNTIHNLGTEPNS